MTEQTQERLQSSALETKRKVYYQNAIKYLEMLGVSDPKDVINKLYVVYKSIDRLSDLILPGQRQYFPENLNQRTMNRYLSGFEPIYSILQEAYIRQQHKKHFDKFWDKCLSTLAVYAYSDRYFFRKDGANYRKAFNFWSKEHKNDPEKLEDMYGAFKACFGIVGNEQFCIIGEGPEGFEYSWLRMQECRGNV